MEAHVGEEAAPPSESELRERDKLAGQIRLLERDLRHAASQLADAEARLVELGELEEVIADLRRERDQALREKAEAHEVIQGIQRTRVWRLAAAYWRIRDTILRRRR